MNQLIRCINCDAVFLRTPYDQEPEYAAPPPLSFYSDHFNDRDDFKDFIKNHDGHRMEHLTILEDSLVSDRAYIEPVKVSYFRATNGRENFVIRKSRKEISDPLKYELISGDYSLRRTALDVQARDIEKQLARDFKEAPLTKKKVDSFIRLYSRIIKTVDLSGLERASEDSSHPLEVFYRMDDMTLMYLLRNCHRLLKGKEYSDIERFISKQKDDGVLLLKATFRIEVTERTQAQEDIVPTALSIKPAKAKKIG